MRNVNESELKKCIFKTPDDFQRDIRSIFGVNARVEYSLEGIDIIYEQDEHSEDFIEDPTQSEVIEKLSKYYDVQVSSYHIDDCDYCCVWICYTE